MNKIRVRNVKMLIWLQLCTIIIVIVVVWIYNSIKPAIATIAIRGPGTVEGVIYSVKDSSALIDGQIVKEGDTISGIKVIKIERNTVEFKKNGKTWQQKVYERPNPVWQEIDLIQSE